MRFTAFIQTRFYLLAVLVLIGGCGGERPDTTGANAAASIQPDAPASTLRETTILVVGDSISAHYGLEPEQGWVYLAEAKLDAQLAPSHSAVNIVNGSISGDTTSSGVRRLPALLERYQPDIVVLELGGNDGLRGYPVEEIEQNLVSMSTQAREAGAKVLILGMQIPANYGVDYQTRFANAFSLAAERSDSALLPFLLEPIAMDRNQFQADGIHPTAEGAAALVGPVVERLSEMLPVAP